MKSSEQELLEKVPGLQIGKNFDAKAAEECFGDYVENVLSPYETLYSFKNLGFIVWSEGPRTGEIYRIVKHKESGELERVPSLEEIEYKIKAMLEEAVELHHRFTEFIPAGDKEGKRYEVAEEKRKKLAEILNFLFTTYYDPKNHQGIEAAILAGNNEFRKKYLDWIET